MDLVRAGFGRRLAALVIDWLASMLIVRVVFPWADFLPPEGQTSPFMTLTLAVFFVEVAVLTSLMGGSFGQILLGVRIVRVDGSRLWPVRVLIRTVLLCLVIPAIIVDSDGRGLHDKAVDSRAVRALRATN